MGYTNLAYVIAAVFFILGIKKLSSPKTARNGNSIASIGMLIAIIATVVSPGSGIELDFKLIAIGMIIGSIIGATFAIRVQMTQMPQMVAIFNGFGGGASAFVASAEYFNKFGTVDQTTFLTATITLTVFIGTLTLTGSFIAFGKLQGFISGKPIVFPGQQAINGFLTLALVVMGVSVCIGGGQEMNMFYGVLILAAILGITLTIPIGGADMPVVISMLNSYSGWAAAGIGFTLENTALIITGALVGSSGAILSYIMCKGMNRSFFNVILGGFGAKNQTSSKNAEQRPVKSGNAEDAAFLMKNASSVIIVPGYGMAVAQAQHALREMAETLKKNGIKVSYAVHPVAGRMPGHMNVLLAEANVPYDEVFELEEINNDFANSDVAFVIGANDVTNPVAKTDPQSPIYGMPVLDVEKCKSVLFVKRSLSPGYAGIDNELFYRDNTLMLFADAKKMTEDIIKNL